MSLKIRRDLCNCDLKVVQEQYQRTERRQAGQRAFRSFNCLAGYRSKVHDVAPGLIIKEAFSSELCSLSRGIALHTMMIHAR
jgi:hypothetical protein